MLAAWYKKQMVNEAREEGWKEAFREWQTWRNELEEWERQKAEAEKAGVAFREPRPPAPDAEQRSSV